MWLLHVGVIVRCIQCNIFCSQLETCDIALSLFFCWKKCSEDVAKALPGLCRRLLQYYGVVTDAFSGRIASIMMRMAAKLGNITVVDDCPFMEWSSHYTLLTSVHTCITADARKAKVSFLFRYHSTLGC